MNSSIEFRNDIQRLYLKFHLNYFTQITCTCLPRLLHYSLFPLTFVLVPTYSPCQSTFAEAHQQRVGRDAAHRDEHANPHQRRLTVYAETDYCQHQQKCQPWEPQRKLDTKKYTPLFTDKIPVNLFFFQELFPSHRHQMI